jgi:uncharacterized protein with PQ loop repeat
VDLPLVLAWIGTVLFLVRLLPQPLHLWRHRRDEGVSAQALTNNLVSDAFWLPYGLVAGLPPVWFASVVAVPLDLLTIVLVRRRVTPGVVATGTAWAAALAGAWMLGGAAGLGVALAASVVVNHGPQVLAALRSDDLSGLHPATWWFSLAEALLWGVYGAALRDPALIAYSAVLASAATVILVRIAATQSAYAPAT